ncbi:MAG TPA: hypothetical protein EYM79_02650 [Planctomycetes bacterium]|nr:hypothetical protein [Planctomycetaceae bacterium]HIN53187.1 hypothetical protein [Planctomycetota bacterium]
MNIPASLMPDEAPEIEYSKSNFTWLVVGGAGLTIVPFVLFVVTFVERALDRTLLLEHLGKNTQGNINMTGIEDILTYILMLFMGMSVGGILCALIGTVIILVQYNSEAGFKAVRAGCGTALCCQGIFLICACVLWIAEALALINGDKIDPILDVRIVYTPDRLAEVSRILFLNNGMLWGVWVIILPVFMMIYFAEMDLKRRRPTHI